MIIEDAPCANFDMEHVPVDVMKISLGLLTTGTVPEPLLFLTVVRIIEFAEYNGQYS